jgi:GTP-binding protein
MSYTIALIGRTNVGKSTLFNKLIENNQALTSAQPNTTRDRNYGEVIWRGEKIKIVDTGGLDAFDFINVETGFKPVSTATIEKQILEQTHQACVEADLILFVTDSRDGILPQDKKLAKILKRISVKDESVPGGKKPIILVANKVDSTKLEQSIDLNELQKLNFGDPFYVSAKSGRGTGDLLDHIFKTLKTVKKTKSRKSRQAQKIKPIKLTLIGRPNVGKSSLLNALLDKKHAIISAAEHTTREPQDITFTYKKQPFTIIDTAGIRKKAKIKKGIENFGVQRSLEALKNADVAILVVDINQRLTTQDNYLAQEVRQSGSGLIIVANKWDLIKNKKTNTINEYKNAFYQRFPYLWWAPIIFTSALTKMRVKNILDLAAQINEEKNKTIDQKTIKIFTKKFIEFHKPTRGKGIMRPRIKGFSQIKTNPPTFLLELYPNADLHKSYLKYIENQLRKTYGFNGVPIHIKLEQAKTKHGTQKFKIKQNDTPRRLGKPR